MRSPSRLSVSFGFLFIWRGIGCEASWFRVNTAYYSAAIRSVEGAWLRKTNKGRFVMAPCPSVQICQVLLCREQFDIFSHDLTHLLSCLRYCFGDFSAGHVARWALICNSVAQTAATCRAAIKVWHRLALRGARIDCHRDSRPTVTAWPLSALEGLI